jgi:hypothetical protein
VIVRFSKVIYIRDEFTMLRRSLFVSALMLAGVVGFASSAKAQTAPPPGEVNQPVKFSAIVPTSCTLTPGTTPDGVLGVNGTNTILSSSIPGGTAAQLVVNCNNGTLKVAAPKVSGTGTTTFAAADLKATVAIGDKIADSSGATIALTSADKDANVNIEATSNTAISPGTYNFTVVVTATPGS